MSESSMLMEGGIIENNTAFSSGGGVDIGRQSTFTMNGNSVIRNNRTERLWGGGIYVSEESLMTMNGGIIENNAAVTFGGGIISEKTAL